MGDLINFKDVTTINMFNKVASPYGSRKDALSTELKGFRMSIGEANGPSHMERQGYVFFTRPHLNLTVGNCLKHRHLIQILNSSPKSVQSWVRSTLSPGLFKSAERLQCPLTDNENIFIPILSNSIKSLSGWPDYVLETYTSPEGQAKEVHTMVDSKMDYLKEFDLDATFHNMADEPLNLLFYIWERYMGMVFEGLINPLPRFIAENEIDYNTRIYRIITDKTDRYVSKIAACGAAFPISLPTGEFANYDSSNVFTARKDITIRFKCNGALYYDDILKMEFNEAVMIFNPKIRQEFNNGTLATDRSSFIDVSDFPQKGMFRGLAYPYINLYDDRLMWLVDIANPEVGYVFQALDALEVSLKELVG